MKKMLNVIACLSMIAILVLGVSHYNTKVVKAEGEQPDEIQEVEPGNSENEELNATNNNEESWSDFFADPTNDQTIVVEDPDQLTQDQQMDNIEAVGGIGQSKDVFTEDPEETQDKKEDNEPTKYYYTINTLDCNGNIISSETVEVDKPTENVTIKATGCQIPTTPEDRPDELPQTSTTEPVYDSTPAAPWYIYLAAIMLVLAVAYCIAKPFLAKNAAEQH